MLDPKSVRLVRRSRILAHLSFAVVIGLAVAPQRASAQEGEGPATLPEPRVVDVPRTAPVQTRRTTIRPTRTETPPEIDGRLDDAVWRTAAKITEFVQQAPLDGAPATEQTDAYVAYDSDYLYFAFYAHYSDPSIMRANRVDRDRAASDDLITVYFDTFMDQQRGYDFDVNAYGVQGDGIITASGFGAIPRADRSWDTLFETDARIVDDGYIAEMAIPFKSLRYPSLGPDKEHRWGFQIVREIKGKDQENDVWAPMSRDESSFFAQMGVLEGMSNISRSRNLEIMPTFTAIQYGAIDPTEEAYVNQGTDPDAGVNVKYGVTSNLTADFTINPDFSQIESDRPQIEVNQRFPIFYRELRPFFIEGAEIFDMSGPVTFVHTRTIVDPDWGAKLTGKVGPVSVGFVATNDRAPGNIEDRDDPAFDQAAYTVIGRARYDLWSESNIGAIFTDREFLDSNSRLAGVDGNFRLSPTLTADVRAVGAWRQDLEGVSTSGNVLDAGIRQNGRYLSWSLSGYQISPDFDTDVGFVRRTDQRRLSGDVSYKFWPESWIIDWGPRVSYARNWNFDGMLEDEELRLNLNFSFARNISLSGGLSHDMERYGGIDFDKTHFSSRLNVSSSRSISFGANFGIGDQVRYIADPYLGHEIEWGINTTLRPFSRLTSQLDLSSSRLTDPRSGEEVFDVKILRASSTFQFTDRLGARNITEYDNFNETFDFNILVNYRVNAGTVLYLGYDDHYQQYDLIDLIDNAENIDQKLFFSDDLRRTNRALFLKFQYLLRY